MTLVMMRVAECENAPAYCCSLCYDVAIDLDPTLAAHFDADDTPLLFTMSESLHRPHPIYTQCIVCDRYVFQILHEVDITTRINHAIRSHESAGSLHLELTSRPSWMFHGPTTEFPTLVAALLKDSRFELDLLMPHIHSVVGIPSRAQIAQRIHAHFHRGTTNAQSGGGQTTSSTTIPDDIWEDIDQF